MRRSTRIVLWSGAAACGTLLLLAGLILIGANTDMGRDAIERLTRQLTGGMVRIIGLAGRFPTRLSVARLELTDARGVWLVARDVTVEWTPAALLAGRISVQSVHATSVSMQRLPQSSAQSTGKTSMPRIYIDQADFDKVDLGAELAGAPASLTLRGSARLRSVREMQFDVTARRLNGDGHYDAHLRFDAERMRAALKLQEPADGPLENILGLPGLGDLMVDMNFDGPRSAEKLQLSVQAGSLSGHAAGTLDLKDLAADLSFDFDSAVLKPRADLQWSHIAVRGHWLGGIKTPTASAHLEASDLHAPGSLRLANVNADLSADKGVAFVRGELTGLEIPGPQPSLLAADPLNLTASMHLDESTRPLHIKIDHKVFSLRARWLTAGKQSASWQLNLPDLMPLAALAGQHAGGHAAIQGQLDYADSAARVNLSAAVDMQGGGQGWLDLFGPRSSMQLAGTVSRDSIDVQKLNVSGGALSGTASGNFALAQRELRAQWNLEVGDLAALSSSIAGTLSTSGSVQGAVTALKVDAQAESKLSVRGGSSGAISAQVRMQGIPSAPAGTLAAQGSLDGSPLQADVSVQRTAAGMVHTVVRQVSWRSARVDGDVTTKLATGTSSGHVMLQIGQLRDLQHLLGVDIAGGVAGSLELNPEVNGTRMRLQFGTQDLIVNSLAATLQIAGQGPSDAFGVTVNARIPKLGGGSAALDAAGTLDLDRRAVNLAVLSADYHGQQFRLLAPARFEFAAGLAVDSLKLGAQQARLEVQGEAFPDAALKISLSNVQPDLVNVFAPDLLAAGRIDVHAELQDSLQNPSGQVSVKAVGVRFADDAALGLPAADLTAEARLMGSSADVTARLVAGAGSELTVAGRAPEFRDGDLDLKISGKLPMTLFNPLLEARGQHAEGSLQVDAGLTGSIAQPQIGGSATLSQGSFHDYGRGLTLTSISADLVGDAAGLQIKSLKATAAPGTLAVTGNIGLLQPKIPIDVKITAKNAQPVVSKLVTANFDAELQVGGTLAEHLDVSGLVHLNRTLIGIPNSLPPNVAVLDVRRHGTAARPAPEKPLAIDLDVKVQAPQQILVQGRGLNAEMGGDLQISGTAASPRVSGGFEMQRGSFSLASSTLNFTSGRVGFSGEGLQNKIDPTLDFTAETSISNPQGTATLHIDGYADAPKFEFTSNPALPQDEIMARLMFGESASQLSALQLAEIGAALASLSGVGGDSSLNPLAKVQKTLGLDRLSIGSGPPTSAASSENTGASIAAGRYITKHVYVEAKQNTTGTSQLEADVDLTKRLKLQTKLGNGTASVQGTTPENDPGSSIGLTYQFEY